MTTQGDIGPVPDFVDDEPEFPGTGSLTRVGEHDSAVPRAREGEWRRSAGPEAYEPVAGEAWGSPEPRMREAGGHVEEADSSGSVGSDPRFAQSAGRVDRVAPSAGEFTPFRTTGELTAELARVYYGEPVSMLTRWFGEPAAPRAAAVEHGSPSPNRRATGRRRSAHRAHRAAETARTEVAKGASDGRSASVGWEFAAVVVVPALVLAGLLYYFGWARASARSAYLGFDESVLDTPAREYLADGLRALYRPLLVAVAALLAVRAAHPRLLVWLRRHRRIATWCTWALRCGWFAVPGATWAAVYRWPARGAQWWSLLLPCALAAGLLVCAYGVLLSRRIGAHRRDPGAGARPWSPSALLVAAAVVLCLFWASSAYAKVSGRDAGKAVAQQLPRRTGVVLYSVQDLRMRSDDGVAVEEEIGASYRYRYTGLRLLRRAPGTLFLLPEHWSWQRPRLLVVHEDARLRVEYERTR
ncbi:hypothetical protein OG948_19755 [Embleya sp. NBC_00888]|uniref:hypothetical protein n=1 Tax=Embleya sp. NBC_00888 TaxID=2975960 RepID=UPI003866BB02|nr:hypothetical protein OG948_19755 [Embleya sp. NBC_00888]